MFLGCRFIGSASIRCFCLMDSVICGHACQKSHCIQVSPIIGVQMVIVPSVKFFKEHLSK